MRVLQGAYGIISTPFQHDGSVDHAQIAQMINRLRKSALKGVVVCGSTSESAMLGEEENMAVMATAAKAVEGSGLSLVCGAASADPCAVRRYLQYAGHVGAIGALVPPPYYFTYPEEETAAFYQSLAVEKGVPVIAYQIPAFAPDIPLSIVPELLRMPHLIGIKNSSANIKQLMHQIELRDRIRPDFSILTGTDDALLPSLAGGCDGSFTALGAILPDQLAKIYRAVADGDLARAQKIQKKLLPLLRAADAFPFPVGYKLLAEAAGIMKTAYRQALSEQTREKMPQIKAVMQELLESLEQE